MKKFVFLAALVVSVFSGYAQSTKIAYVNLEMIMQLHPDYKSIQSQLETLRQQQATYYQGQVQKLQAKEQEYMQAKQSGVYGAAALADIENQYKGMMQNLQQFEQNSEMELMQKQQALMMPLNQKVVESVETVANEKGFDYVLNQNVGGSSTIVYVKQPKANNITLDVMKKLSIPISAELQAEFDKL